MQQYFEKSYSIITMRWIKVVLDVTSSRKWSLDVLTRKPYIMASDGHVVEMKITQSKTRVIELGAIFKKQECNDFFYDEEAILTSFLTSQYSSLRDLCIDIQWIHEYQLHTKTLTDGILHLHNIIRDHFLFPDYIGLNICMVPCHYLLTRCMSEFAILSRKEPGILETLHKCIVIENSSEIETVTRFRRLCGLQWLKKPPKSQEIQVNHGSTSWKFLWSCVMTRYQNHSYFERIDERLLWVSLWFALVSRDTSILTSSPKLLIMNMAYLAKT